MRFPELEIDLRLRGFEKNVPAGSFEQLGFDDIPAQAWYDKFVADIDGAIGKSHLPVYRMADGEFMFCVGRKAALPPRGMNWVGGKLFALRQQLSILRNRSGGATCWGEHYDGVNVDELMSHYRKCLRNVADSGMLAIHFGRCPSRFSEEYIEPMSRWLSESGIALTHDNYTAFYFVYALLCGPDSHTLFRDRNVLVVTSANADKQERIGNGLQEIGAKNVEFLGISPNRSLLDVIDLSKVRSKVDIVLVAAGIGSVNILDQLKPLNTVCIDAGICVECYADPGRRKERLFLQGDAGL